MIIMMNNIYLKARLKKAKNDIYLNDRFFVCSRCNKVSYEELSRIENDFSYIPKPDISAELIFCYDSLELAENVCFQCPVKKVINETSPRNTNFNVAKDNKPKQTILKKINNFDSTKNTIYYKARLIHSLKNLNFSNRKYVAEDIFGITEYQLKNIETNHNFIAHTELLSKIIKEYANQAVFNYVCEVCPVTESIERIKAYG